MRLKTTQGVPVKPENWRSMVRAHLNGEPIPAPLFLGDRRTMDQEMFDGGVFRDECSECGFSGLANWFSYDDDGVVCPECFLKLEGTQP